MNTLLLKKDIAPAAHRVGARWAAFLFVAIELQVIWMVLMSPTV